MRNNRSEFNAHAGMQAGVRKTARKVAAPRPVLPLSRVLRVVAWTVAAIVAASYAVPFLASFV